MIVIIVLNILHDPRLPQYLDRDDKEMAQFISVSAATVKGSPSHGDRVESLLSCHIYFVRRVGRSRQQQRYI